MSNEEDHLDYLIKSVLWLLSPLVVTCIAYGINSLWGYAGAMAYLAWFYWSMNRKP